MPEHHEPDTTISLPPVDVRTEAFADVMADYPYPHEVDSLDDLPYVTMIATDDGDPFTGRIVGYGSSYRESHLNHAPGSKPPKGVRCSGCRWTDTAIVVVAPDQYVFISLGKSALDGEWQRDTVIWTSDAAEVLRKCFAPTKPEFSRSKGAKAIPPHNGDAFRQAAVHVPAFAALVEQYNEVIPEVNKSADDPLANL